MYGLPGSAARAAWTTFGTEGYIQLHRARRAGCAAWGARGRWQTARRSWHPAPDGPVRRDLLPGVFVGRRGGGCACAIHRPARACREFEAAARAAGTPARAGLPL